MAVTLVRILYVKPTAELLSDEQKFKPIDTLLLRDFSSGFRQNTRQDGSRIPIINKSDGTYIVDIYSRGAVNQVKLLLEERYGITTVREEEPPSSSDKNGANQESKFRFLEKFVLNNPSLSPTAKTVLQEKINKEKGPWNVEDKSFILGIEESGNRITIKTRNGESYIYY